MKHRIAVGALVIDNENRLLMVNHKKENCYDFWVAPGGGVVETESQEAAVIREVKEETGLDVAVGELMYIEEFWQPTIREVKFWYLCDLQGGNLDSSAEEAIREHIVDAQFITREALGQLTVFPEIVVERLWSDIQQPLRAPVYIGLRKMAFY